MASHANTLVTWCEELTHWKRPWCWERWRAGGKGGNRGWDGWMASPTQWTRVWVNSRRQWRTGKPAVCSPWGCRVRHALLTEKLQHGYLIVSVCFLVVSVLCRKGSGVFLTGSTAPLLLIDHLTPCGASCTPESPLLWFPDSPSGKLTSSSGWTQRAPGQRTCWDW